ncbi:MAG TPA: outer membrane beta-barrel protein [Phycisphaerae bacterium]|nr:outer membrane beta-barrel protein [Phycisphaerae bacterium]
MRSTGIANNGAPNVLYGPGNKAWSVTVTPTYQRNIFFTRGELSYVRALDTTPGAVFGKSGNDKSQARAVLEMGVLF